MAGKPLFFKDLKPGDKFVLKNSLVRRVKLNVEVRPINDSDGRGLNCVILSGGIPCWISEDAKVIKIDTR